MSKILNSFTYTHLKQIVLVALTVMLLFLISPGIRGIYLIIAIAFHELTHAAAAKYLGYSNIRFSVIPFLGAKTEINMKDKIMDARELMIFVLSAPLLNLAIGVILFAIVLFLELAGLISNSHHQFLPLYFIILSLVNLLPLIPLDGGQALALALSGLAERQKRTIILFLYVVSFAFLILSFKSYILPLFLFVFTIIPLYRIFFSKVIISELHSTAKIKAVCAASIFLPFCFLIMFKFFK